MKPRPPAGLRAAGAALWRATVAEFDLAQHESVQLLQACRLADSLDDLQAVLAAEGATVTGEDGTAKPSPVLVELRQQRITLARLLGALRVPDPDDHRPQRRTGVRGTYRR